MKKRIVAVILLSSLAAGYYFYSTLPTNQIATGTVESNVSRLGTKIGGRVAMVYFSEGDTVKKGDVIVSLDDRVEKAKLDMAQTRLQETGNIKITQAEFDIAKLNFEETKITAPFDGVVDLIAVEAGDVVSPNLPIVQLREEANLEITAYISQTHLATLKLGDTVLFRTDIDEQTHEAKVEHISSKSEFVPKQISTKEDRDFLVYKIKLKPQGELTHIKSGMFVTILKAD